MNEKVELYKSIRKPIEDLLPWSFETPATAHDKAIGALCYLLINGNHRICVGDIRQALIDYNKFIGGTH